MLRFRQNCHGGGLLYKVLHTDRKKNKLLTRDTPRPKPQFTRAYVILRYTLQGEPQSNLGESTIMDLKVTVKYVCAGTHWKDIQFRISV